LHGLVDAGHTVIVVEHDMSVVARADWVIDLGPGGGDAGGRIVASGPPADVARSAESRTAPYLARTLAGSR
jgi:excinuclease ABC subunit A